MAKLKGQLRGRGYRQAADYYGFPAYAIDELARTGLFGRTRESVIEHLTSEWIIKNMETLSALGIDMKWAKKAGYVPVKFKNE